jgi:hypothetical protein
MRRWIVLATIALMTLSLAAATKPAPTPPSPSAKKAAPKTTQKAPSKKTPSKSAKKSAPKVAPKPLAPDTVAHPIALFLSQMCGDGKKRVTFKASAVGTRFFIEEPTGVTIYGFDGTAYRKESFVKGSTIDKVLKRYAVRAAGMS